MQEKVLFVDDDSHILAAYKRNLRRQFDIHTASSGEEGLKLIKHQGPFAVILSDLKMPGMDGFEFLSQAKELSPDSPCIMLTGHAELKSSLRAVNEGYIFRFLTKPCKINILSKSIQEGLERYFMNAERRKGDEKRKAAQGSKKVLIVDDDPENLSMLAHALKKQPSLEVITADNARIALSLLRNIKIDLVVLDREMPDMDGLELFDTIIRDYANIPMVMMTWCLSEEIMDRMEGRTGCRCVEKPFEYDWLRDMVTDELYSGPKGLIDGISIPAFLQMIEMEEKTCTLTISSEMKSGTMFFLKGSLIDAESGVKTGQAAAFEMINWEHAAIEIEDACRKREKVIRPSLMQILMEAAKEKDDINDKHIS